MSKPSPKHSYPSSESYFTDGGNYCRWCGDEIKPQHKYCGLPCVAEALADARQRGDDDDANRISATRWKMRTGRASLRRLVART